MQSQRQRPRERGEEVTAAVFLDGDDGVAPRTGVATEGEHRYARIDPGCHQMGFIGLDVPRGTADRTPPETGGPTTAALKWQHRVENRVDDHRPSLAARYDNQGKWPDLL